MTYYIIKKDNKYRAYRRWVDTPVFYSRLSSIRIIDWRIFIGRKYLNITGSNLFYYLTEEHQAAIREFIRKNKFTKHRVVIEYFKDIGAEVLEFQYEHIVPLLSKAE